MEKEGIRLADAPSFVDLCTLHQHAMRYYRLWIYACNIVLAFSTLVFSLFAISILIDPRITLLSGVELYQPTFLYAYVAVALQLGILQAVGCVGALRLHQKLLNTYWTLLLFSTILDVGVGLVWGWRLDRIKGDLIPNLKQRLNSQYGNDTQFTQIWDSVQHNDFCCGVEAPTDFLDFNDSSSNRVSNSSLPWDTSFGLHHVKLPSTCCVFSISQLHPTQPTSSTPSNLQHQLRSNRVSNYNNRHSNFTMPSLFGTTTTHNRRKILHSRKHTDPSQNPHPHRHVQTTTEASNKNKGISPALCALPPDILDGYNKDHVLVKVSDSLTLDLYSYMEGPGRSGEEPASHSDYSSSSSSTELPSSLPTPTFSRKGATGVTSSSSSFVTPPTSSVSHSSNSVPYPYILVAMDVNKDGCGEKILEWVDHASDVLFVIGFCIIVFLKGCFVAILRYEIKEMIQKIKLLNGEDDGRTAAMNELIGLTSLYERENEDPGEREGLMATSSSDQCGQENNTVSTNVDAIESDKSKDNVIRREHHNCLSGNHVGMNYNRQSSIVGNHIIGSNNSSASTTPTTATTTAVVISTGGGGGNRRSRSNDNPDPEDFDTSGSAVLGKERKFLQENGGRTLPRNGNNNSSSSNTSGLGGVTGSASAPIPIQSIAKA